jgi:hypothetical protein
MMNNSGERELWQTVVFLAVKEALELKAGMDPTLDRRRAEEWIRLGRRDFRLVCHLAGVDPAFIRSNFLAGRINLDLLVASERSNKREAS